MSLISFRKKRPRIAVFFSGSGSTLQVLLDQMETLNIVCTISSKQKALGRLRGYRQSVVGYTFKFPEDFPQVLSVLKQKKINTIICAGFMKVIPVDFVNGFEALSADQAIVNIHPSLLPAYKGLKSVERAYADKSSIGVTIHNVVEEVDAGQILQRLLAVSAKEISKMTLLEAQVWLRASEQHILKSWGSAVA